MTVKGLWAVSNLGYQSVQATSMHHTMHGCDNDGRRADATYECDIWTAFAVSDDDAIFTPFWLHPHFGAGMTQATCLPPSLNFEMLQKASVELQNALTIPPGRAQLCSRWPTFPHVVTLFGRTSRFQRPSCSCSSGSILNKEPSSGFVAFESSHL